MMLSYITRAICTFTHFQERMLASLSPWLSCYKGNGVVYPLLSTKFCQSSDSSLEGLAVWMLVVAWSWAQGWFATVGRIRVILFKEKVMKGLMIEPMHSLKNDI